MACLVKNSESRLLGVFYTESPSRPNTLKTGHMHIHFPRFCLEDVAQQGGDHTVYVHKSPQCRGTVGRNTHQWLRWRLLTFAAHISVGKF